MSLGTRAQAMNMNEQNQNRDRINYGISQTNPEQFRKWFEGLNGDFSWIFDRIYGANSLPTNVYHSVNAHPYLFRLDEINGEDYLTLCNQRVSEMQRALNNRAIFVSFDDDEAYLHDVLEEEDPAFF